MKTKYSLMYQKVTQKNINSLIYEKESTVRQSDQPSLTLSQYHELFQLTVLENPRKPPNYGLKPKLQKTSLFQKQKFHYASVKNHATDLITNISRSVCDCEVLRYTIMVQARLPNNLPIIPEIQMTGGQWGRHSFK